MHARLCACVIVHVFRLHFQSTTGITMTCDLYLRYDRSASAWFFSCSVCALNRCSDRSRFDRTLDDKTGFVTKSILTVPVFDQITGHVDAVIQAVNRDRSGRWVSFTAEDVQLLETMAVSAGILLRKSQFVYQTVRAKHATQALLQLVQLANSPITSIYDAMGHMARICYAALDADRISVYFVDENKHELFTAVSKDTKGFVLPLGQGLAGWAALRGVHVRVPDVYALP
jgi:adenylate cyclase